MEKIINIPREAAGGSLHAFLSVEQSYHAPCGGRGSCGKCRVKVLDGTFFSVDDPQMPLVPDHDGMILACRALCPPEGGKIALESAIDEAPHHEPAFTVSTAASDFFGIGINSGYGMALDIGTTTLAAALVELSHGKILATASCTNPQGRFGADVMSRIQACREGHLATMQALVLKTVLTLLDKIKEGRGDLVISHLAVAGNPTMLHIFCGISPEGMGQYPFTPVLLAAKQVSGASLGLPFETVTSLPASSAFIGSDVTGGILVTRMTEQNEPALLADIGTNGEIVLFTGKAGGGRLLSCSASAGPALEGANISCGMGGVDGAVSWVKPAEDGTLCYGTVADRPARGLCGSGLCDLAACLLTKGILTPTGYLDKPYRLTGHQVTSSGEGHYAPTSVILTGQDIRQLQLAKSAIRAGIECLLLEAGLCAEDIKHTYLAGGLGYYMDPASACRIGLLPKGLLSSVTAVGNTSLAAAVQVLFDPTALDKTESIAAKCENMALNDCPHFGELFVKHMNF